VEAAAQRYRVGVTLTDDGPNGRGQKPRALIVTIYGLYAREVGGWLSVAAIIQLMAELGVDEPAVRSSISRLKRRGILDGERVNGVAGYTLSDQARTILDEGDRRIFERGQARVDEGWLLAVFSVPETERDKRHQLRSRLAWLGFGTVSAGVWIAPARLFDEARDVLERNGLTEYVDMFRGDHLAFSDVRTQVPRWWDLPRLHGLYEDFLGRYGPVLTSYRRKRTYDVRQAFADYAAALTDWRRLPYSDPGLPPEVLPRGWNGVRAAETFFELQARLAGPAHRFVESVRDVGDLTAVAR
jgi:phenylacetic acid degradation operon negative regulatory protein